MYKSAHCTLRGVLCLRSTCLNFFLVLRSGHVNPRKLQLNTPYSRGFLQTENVSYFRRSITGCGRCLQILRRIPMVNFEKISFERYQNWAETTVNQSDECLWFNIYGKNQVMSRQPVKAVFKN